MRAGSWVRRGGNQGGVALSIKLPLHATNAVFVIIMAFLVTYRSVRRNRTFVFLNQRRPYIHRSDQEHARGPRRNFKPSTTSLSVRWFEAGIRPTFSLTQRISAFAFLKPRVMIIHLLLCLRMSGRRGTSEARRSAWGFSCTDRVGRGSAHNLAVWGRLASPLPGANPLTAGSLALGLPETRLMMLHALQTLGDSLQRWLCGAGPLCDTE